MQLQVRGLKGKEGKLLGDRNAVRQGTILDKLLAACTEKVLDAGPYEVGPEGKLDWNKVLLGDRFYALLQIRLASFGPDYEFKTQCRDGNCRHRFDWKVDLNDLEVKPMSEEDRETFRSGGLFTTVLNDGKEVKYRLATGADEKRIARNRTTGGDSAMLDMLASRINAIEGIGEVKQVDIGSSRVVKTIRSYLEELDWSELVGLLNQLDSHDCGVNAEIEIECPACGGVQEVQLPFERSFFLPTEVTATSNHG
jgi:hypothetical protein